MSKNSAKQIYTQLTEWIKTIKTTTRATAKQPDKQVMQATAPQSYGNVRIKNGPRGRR